MPLLVKRAYMANIASIFFLLCVLASKSNFMVTLTSRPMFIVALILCTTALITLHFHNRLLLGFLSLGMAANLRSLYEEFSLDIVFLYPAILFCLYLSIVLNIGTSLMYTKRHGHYAPEIKNRRTLLILANLANLCFKCIVPTQILLLHFQHKLSNPPPFFELFLLVAGPSLGCLIAIICKQKKLFLLCTAAIALVSLWSLFMLPLENYFRHLSTNFSTLFSCCIFFINICWARAVGQNETTLQTAEIPPIASPPPSA